MSRITIRPARREDVPEIVALLADDPLGADREDTSEQALAAYLAAFERIAADGRNLLVVAEDAGAVAGCLQLTFIPGLSNQGQELALLEGVRVAAARRGAGLGEQMVRWAMAEAGRRGCGAMELMSHVTRTDAQRFYERLGFARSHVGMKRAL
ncbi:MAG: GNAT family N-acetyltransferase [Phenylobacterium sp.]|uniref:GNAT family N-acetyltransferase n=1 Tax=Phenylobacterium sp. TaxID=1871053 RepID=UPI0039190AB6